MIKLHITYKFSESAEEYTFLSTYPYLNDIKPSIFQKGQEENLYAKAPFIADRIWGDIASATNNRKVLNSSVRCVIEFDDGTMKNIPSDIIHATHNF